MPRAVKNGPGWAHEFGSLSVEWVVGALGVNRTGGGCGVKLGRGCQGMSGFARK